MPSRQDQLHSYQFTVQRVVAALVMRETDPAQSPFRRVAGATTAGAIVAVLALAGAALYGVFAGGSGNWRTEGQVIIEKGTGTRYVFYKPDDSLHPVINYTSALLIAGSSAKPTVVTWSQSALDGARRGAPMGIVGAPDSLPDTKHLVRSEWTLCSQKSADGTDPAGKPQSVLLVGDSVTGGQELVPAGRSTQPTALLVSTPDGKRYLVYNKHRYQVTQPTQVLAAFRWAATSPLPVSPALVNALPAGPDLKLLPIPRRGERSSVLPGAKVGQVYRLANAGQYSVLLADGLANITKAQSDLLLADPETPASSDGQAIDLSATEYSVAKKSATGLAAALPFDEAPVLRPTPGSVCVSISDAQGVEKVVVDPKLPDSSAAAVTPARTANGGILADRIVIPAGHGVLVEAVSAPGAPGGAVSLVTDRGIRYPLANRDLAATLGYAGVTPATMPAELVALLPAGPALDPADARQRASS
ncbi:type VII secretion protein EccB [Planosporangium sp. 12N6]|uniref:type VII secretion protein EccB n=1 Tax=Planosporangium spinosum TaxID=3402278 RepID=UPI003CEE5503